MKRQIIFFLGLILFMVLLTLSYMFIFREFSPKNQEQKKLLELDGAEALTALIPKNSIVIDCSKPASITPPLIVTENPDRKDEKVLALPAGKGTSGAKNTGLATYKVNIADEGKYQCWARVRWDDSCSNSLVFQVTGNREKIFGQDAVYNSWHWIPIGAFAIPKGEQIISLKEREDGIAIDQLLLCPNPKYQPQGRIVAGKDLKEGRQFADSFYRSEGHGLQNWNVKSGTWKLMFSLDPNRIPLQYALQGTAEKKKNALCELKGIAFPGATYKFSLFPEKNGIYGLSIGQNKLKILIEISAAGNKLQIKGDGIEKEVSLGDKVRLQQWHKIDIERWGTVLKIKVDGNTVFNDFSLPSSSSEKIFLMVNSGEAVFDDFSAHEIIYLLNGRIPWQLTSTDSLWGSGKKAALVGFKGGISSPEFRLKIKELILDKTGDGQCKINGTSLDRKGYFVDNFSGNLPQKITITKTDGKKIQFKNIAIRFAGKQADIFRFGPYDFSSNNVEDISDYMDFTEEEIQAMNQSPDADIIKRKPRKRSVIGALYNSVWGGGSRRNWRVVDGALQGGTDKRGRSDKRGLTFWQELNGDYEFSCKIKLLDSKSAGQIILYNDSESGLPITIAGKDYLPKDKTHAIIKSTAAGKWQQVKIITSSDIVKVKLKDQAAKSFNLERRNGGGIKLMVPSGTVDFDDISITLKRQKDGYSFNAFDQRNSNWWREGKSWVDHSGISCAFASNWTTLTAPESSGMIHYKNQVNDNLLLGFNVAEASEWFGWQEKHSHIHYPFDNICIKLSSTGNKKEVYEIRINAENRQKTILLRNGKEVASVVQDSNFPIRYCGGHVPYKPRRCRIVLRKKGAAMLLYLNGKKVLSYTDPKPIKTPELRIGGFNTRINFSNMELLEYKK